jgi:hypothetical protein
MRQINFDLIEEALTHHAGERCPDYEPDCYVCKAWRQFDQLRGEEQSMHITINPNDEDTGLWVAIQYWPHEPTHVYGPFETEDEARQYAEMNNFANGQGSYEVKEIFNAHYHEDPNDYRGMGWVGQDGRP